MDLDSLKINGNRTAIAVKFRPKYHLMLNSHSTIIATKTATLKATVSP